MKRPPYLIKMRFWNSRHGFDLWLPLFLIMPLVLALLLAVALILLPFALLAMLFTWRLGYWRPLVLGVPVFFNMLCQMPGLKVDIEHGKGSVYIAVL